MFCLPLPSGLIKFLGFNAIHLQKSLATSTVSGFSITIEIECFCTGHAVSSRAQNLCT